MRAHTLPATIVRLAELHPECALVHLYELDEYSDREQLKHKLVEVEVPGMGSWLAYLTDWQGSNHPKAQRLWGVVIRDQRLSGNCTVSVRVAPLLPHYV